MGLVTLRLVRSTSRIYGHMALVDIVAALKLVCMSMLVMVVIYGTTVYDPRFTMLLVPPFLVYWLSTQGEGSMLATIAELPIFQLFSKILDGMGPIGSKFFLATSGALLGGYLFDSEGKGLTLLLRPLGLA